MNLREKPPEFIGPELVNQGSGVEDAHASTSPLYFDNTPTQIENRNIWNLKIRQNLLAILKAKYPYKYINI